MNQCPCTDDNGVKCQNIMTRHEQKQDGMCIRCAEETWQFLCHDTPVIYKDPTTREFK